MNFSRISGVSSPIKLASNGVSPATGLMAFTRMPEGASPRAQLNWYNCSKGWMITATKTMAVELAPSGIRVNALNPEAGETPLLASFM
ncbi:MAG: SDR family oxidoreductase, partial [Pseudomonadota bacterium]